MSETQRHKESVPAMTIGELSGHTSVSRRALRHYETSGLLNSRRADNGYRYFSRSAIARVGRIQEFVAAGFSLEEIRTFPECMLLLDGGAPCAQTLDIQRDRLSTLEARIATLEQRRYRLKALLKAGEAAALSAEERTDSL
ncbi:MerR family transcriptional regulator [Kushneria phyllosphaerae]|uniref:Nodulation protein NolA n=1 Tax=Kushneria phyllosphaerae TaxID=2100822 RepID=A0A2R8CLR1_9GAMM|nr:MerR family transcriptional regulator [Kushneria phyllosphaerae]SPJ33772.1 Nodulation protein NolA [Kushneria phyllosphaerae]